MTVNHAKQIKLHEGHYHVDVNTIGVVHSSMPFKRDYVLLNGKQLTDDVSSSKYVHKQLNLHVCYR